MHPSIQMGVGLLLLVALNGCGGSSPSDDVIEPPLAPPPEPPQNEAPTATFSTSLTSGTAPLLVSFDASGSFDRDGQITNYSWSFGDGVAATGVAPQHSFDVPADYTVLLTVMDDDGDTSQTQNTISVESPPPGFEVSGTIRILASSAADSDVNDRETTPVSNNSFTEAQDLLNPVSLGGFVNVPGVGAVGGNSTVAGDVVDVYRIALVGEETILLTIGDQDGINDLDLRLWDENQNLVDASLGVTGTETITVAAPGTYYVEVFPFAGASTYVLNIGQGVTANASDETNSWRLSSNFVPHQALYQHTETLPRSAGSSRTAPTASAVRRLAASGDIHLGALPRAAASAVDSTANPPRFLGRLTAAQLEKHATLLALKQLAADDGFTHIEPNFLRHPHLTPGDEFFGLQWHYQNINLPAAWDLTTGTASVTVAVIDTGVRLDHPDLQGQLAVGFDFISDPARANDSDGIDADPNDPGDLSLSGVSSFHGTHVAGTIAAASDNGTGVAGTAWSTRILPLRALGVGGGTSFDIIQAVQYAAGMASTAPAPLAQPVDVINMSLGGPAFSANEQQVYNEVTRAGVIVIASAGNNASASPMYPAGYDNVVSVSATTITNAIAPYSNFGPTVDVAAPGGDASTDINGDGIGDGVISTAATDAGGAIQLGYAPMNGTSMAAPHVAGVAALMKALNPAMSPADFELALTTGELTDDLGGPGRDDGYGHGLINAHKAAIAALEMNGGDGPDPGPVVAAAPGSVNFAAFATSVDIVVSNVGSGSAIVDNVSSSAPWLTATATGVDADGFGVYTLSVDRSGLNDGLYAADLSFDTNANDVTVSVAMQVSSLDLDANAGLHFVALVDLATGQTIAQVAVSPSNGEYPFTLSGVPAGHYRVFAGTDLDDDFFICDGGEACGAYRTLDQPEAITISADTPGLDFVSGFRANLSSLFTSGAAAPSTGATGIGIGKRANLR